MSLESSIKDYDMEEFVTKLTKKKYNAEKEKWPRFRDDFKAKLISEGAELYAALEAKKAYQDNADDKHSELCRKIYGKLWKLLGEDAKDDLIDHGVANGVDNRRSMAVHGIEGVRQVPRKLAVGGRVIETQERPV